MIDIKKEGTIFDMRKQEINKEFLLEKMLKNRASVDKEKEFCESVCSEIENVIFNLNDELKKESDKDEIEELNKKIGEYQVILRNAKKSTNADESYIVYEATPFFEYREDEPIIEQYKKIEESREELERLNVLVNSYLKIIKELPDIEFEICFSEKSPSIYIKTKIDATEENVENFLYLGGVLDWEMENVYEEDECYDCDLKIEIRLSDHSFGGFTKFEGYGDYVSYRKSCINYVYKF